MSDINDTVNANALKTTGLALAAGAFLLAAPGQAQAQMETDDADDYDTVEQRLSFDGRAGVAVPAGDLADFTDPGFNAGLGVAYRIHPRVALRADGDVNLLQGIGDEEQDGVIDDVFASDVRLWQYNGGVQVYFVKPEETGFRFTGSLNAGATTIDPEGMEGEQTPGVEGTGTETRFSTGAALTLGYQATENIDIFLRPKTSATFLQQDDFEGDPDAPEAAELSDTWWVFPLTAGVQVDV